MTPIELTLLFLLLALVLFATERIPVDIIGIILVIALTLSGVLTANEAVAGFGDNIILTIGGLFVLTAGLVKTGIVDNIGRKIYGIAGSNELFLTMSIMVVAAISASVLKNTTTTAMFLPVVLGISERARIAPSKLLMPLAFGAILGGSCTLIGTSTNLAVSGAMTRYGLAPLSMFELTPVGIIIAAVGIVYMLLIGVRMLPRRGNEETFTEQYQFREYITEVLVLPGSRLVGKTFAEANLNREMDLTVLGIIRGKERLAAAVNERIEADDLLVVEGKKEDILRIKAEVGIEIKADFELNDSLLESGKIELFEVLIMRSSKLAGRTLKSAQIRQTYDLTVLALSRHNTTFISKISEIPLRFGDVLLVQGNRASIQPLVTDGDLLLLDDISTKTTRHGKQFWALTAFAIFILLSLSKYFFTALGVGFEIPLVICVLLGVLTLLGTQTVLYSELYNVIDFRLLVLIACMISFGTAMEKTGADVFLAGQIQKYLGAYGSTALLAGFYILTVLLTQPMSNQAAALVVLPVAVKTAVALNLDPRPFAVAVTFAASSSFLTPLEPACVLIYTPGRYRFMDFVKIGFILTVLVFVISVWLIPYFWSF